MRTTIGSCWAIVPLFLCIDPAHAQLPLLDISSEVQAGPQVELRIRPDGNFNGLFSSVVFTLRCDQAAGTVISDPLQDLPQAQYCAVFKSGPEQVQGPYLYQIFAGFGSLALSNLSTSWIADQEVVLCRIPLSNANGSCILVNDTWTEANNGSYYVSLNGVDRTGTFYGISTAIADQAPNVPVLAVQPNPANTSIRLSASMHTSAASVQLRLLDGVGKELRSVQIALNSGNLLADIDLQGLAAGSYTLEVITPDERLVKRFVKE